MKTLAVALSLVALLAGCSKSVGRDQQPGDTEVPSPSGSPAVSLAP